MLERLTLTEVGLLLILGALVAICIYAGRMLRELQRVNRHLRALRNDDDWLRARAERERLALNLDPHGEPVAEIARENNISSGEGPSGTGQPGSPIAQRRGRNRSSSASQGVTHRSNTTPHTGNGEPPDRKHGVSGHGAVGTAVGNEVGEVG
jgi:hypothetical protein